MSDYNYLPGSNGSGDPALMHIGATRSVGSTTITVDSVVNVPAHFIGTSGTLTSAGILDSTKNITNMKCHVSGSTIVIDGFEPGSTDVGNVSTEVLIIKPTTGWLNRVAAFKQTALKMVEKQG